MADKKITQLNTDPTPTIDDVIPATDITSNITNKITLGSLPVSTATQTVLNAKANDNAVVHLAGTETITGAKTFTESTFLNKVGAAYINANPNALTIPQVREEVTTDKKKIISETWTQDTANSRGMKWDWYDDVDGSLTGVALSKSIWGYLTDLLGNPSTFEMFMVLQKVIGGINRITFRAEASGNIKLNTPQGVMVNGKIVTSASSGSLTVSIKTLAGNDPSTSDPVYVRIGDTIRTINSSLIATSAPGTNYLNLGSTELQNLEVDLFAYLVWNSVSGDVRLFASRIPYATKISDFVISATDPRGPVLDNNPSWNGSDQVELIGRFNAILSNTNQWSIPATSVIINRPIYETRWLSYTAAYYSTSGSGGTYNNIRTRYKIVDTEIKIILRHILSSKGTLNGSVYVSTPMSVNNGDNIIISGAIIPVGSNITSTRGWCISGPGDASLQFTKASQSAVVQWTDMAVSDEILVNGSYEIV